MVFCKGGLFGGHPPHVHPQGDDGAHTDAQALTFVQRLGHLAGVPTAIGTTFLNPGAFVVNLAALDTGGREAAGFLGSRAVPLLHGQHILEERTAGQTLVVLLGEPRLRETRTIQCKTTREV